jgi:tRNA pseudouridine55 synthase
MVCEKGTYVRAVARDLAAALGTCGHVSRLHRAAVGPFTDARSVTLEALEASTNRDALLLPVAAGLSQLPELRMGPDQATAIRHGNAVLLTGAGAPLQLDAAWASFAGKALALGRVEAGHFKPDRVIL